MGTGWAFTFIGVLYMLLCPILWVVMRWGPGWRKEKKERVELKMGEKGKARKDAATV